MNKGMNVHTIFNSFVVTSFKAFCPSHYRLVPASIQHLEDRHLQPCQQAFLQTFQHNSTVHEVDSTTSFIASISVLSVTPADFTAPSLVTTILKEVLTSLHTCFVLWFTCSDFVYYTISSLQGVIMSY